MTVLNNIIISPFFDYSIEELTKTQRIFDARLIQLSRGDFKASTNSINFGGITISKRHTNSKYMTSGWIPDVVACFLPLDNYDFFANGKLKNKNTLSISAGNEEYSAIIQKNSESLLLLIEQSSLIKYLGKSKALELNEKIKLYKNEVYETDTALTQFIFSIYQFIFWHNNCLRIEDINTESYSRLVILYLYDFICNKHFKKSNYSLNYSKVLQRSLNYISTEGFDSNLNDLSKNVFSSKRTIQYSFSKILGMSPLQYLKIYKLNAVRSVFKQVDSTKYKVFDILNQFHLTNHSRFKSEYSNFFNESLIDAFNDRKYIISNNNIEQDNGNSKKA